MIEYKLKSLNISVEGKNISAELAKIYTMEDGEIIEKSQSVRLEGQDYDNIYNLEIEKDGNKILLGNWILKLSLDVIDSHIINFSKSLKA